MRRVLACCLLLFSVAGAAGQTLPSGYLPAQTAFQRLTSEDRFMIPMLLIAAGHYDGLSTGEFNQRIFRGIQTFQQSLGSAPTGILTTQEHSRLRQTGLEFLGLVGLKEVSHPTANAKLYVPLKLLDPPQRTARGVSFEGEMAAVDFSSFLPSEVSFPDLFLRLSTTSAQRQVTYKVLRSDFFVVAGRNGSRNFYSRFNSQSDMLVGFTLAWNDGAAAGHGDRVAAVMSNLFFTGLAASVDRNAPPVSPPTSQKRPETERGGSGTAFLVSAEGHLLTNNHVVNGCSTISVVGFGNGQVLAKDTTNDLAVAKVAPLPDVQPLQSAGRMTKLGEDVVAMGYPLQGLLGGLNVTAGNVSALSGLRNDSTKVQFTAAIQPGNSGGPLLDRSGALIGVVTSKLNEVATLKADGTIPQNVNFAIRKEVVAAFLASQGIALGIAAEGAEKLISDVAEMHRRAVFSISCNP